MLALLASIILAFALAMAGPRAQLAEGPGERGPVLVELFTSEGCSSCPPADRLLGELTAAQPVAGAEVISLAFHVDYWDRLGWRDRFASPDYSARQRAYAGSLPGGRVYTPQLVVGGSVGFVGSDRRQAIEAIAAAAEPPIPSLSLDLIETSEPDLLRLSLSARALPAPKKVPLRLMLAIAEDGLATDVARGENAGRRLLHTAVVRRMERLTEIAPEESYDVGWSTPVELDAGWVRERLRIVVWLQEPGPGAVVAAGNAVLLPTTRSDSGDR